MSNIERLALIVVTALACPPVLPLIIYLVDDNKEGEAGKMTNGDAMRSMTNEQLADFMADEAMRLAKPVFDYFGFGIEKQIAYLARLAWLNQEIEN